MEKTTSHRGETVKSYTIAFKLKVIDYAVLHGNHKASRDFKVDRKRIREWRQNEKSLRAHDQRSKRKNLNGQGRAIEFPDIDDQVHSWVTERREAGCRVTGGAIRKEALRLHRLKGSQSFKASDGWYDKFMKRYNLAQRRQTHMSQKKEEELSEKMSNFLRFVIKLRKSKGYELSEIGNMDETPIWMDMPGNYTIEPRGTKTVSLVTTGHEKTRFTVKLAAMADGTKLKPLVLFKGRFIRMNIL